MNDREDDKSDWGKKDSGISLRPPGITGSFCPLRCELGRGGLARRDRNRKEKALLRTVRRRGTLTALTGAPRCIDGTLMREGDGGIVEKGMIRKGGQFLGAMDEGVRKRRDGEMFAAKGKVEITTL